MSRSHIFFWFFIIGFLLLGIFALYQIRILKTAHSSFENYSAFRGCVSIVERGPTYGICTLVGGEKIKIVEKDGKWFLDGDYGW